jgi:hypothetical protein
LLFPKVQFRKPFQLRKTIPALRLRHPGQISLHGKAVGSLFFN